MRDRTLQYVQLAADVRRLWDRLAVVSNSLVELADGELAAKCCDIELELIDLHAELIELSMKSVKRSPRKQPARRQDDGIPF